MSWQFSHLHAKRPKTHILRPPGNLGLPTVPRTEYRIKKKVTLGVLAGIATALVVASISGAFRHAGLDAALIAAIKISDEKRVGTLLACGADPNASDIFRRDAVQEWRQIVPYVRAALHRSSAGAPTALQIALDEQLVTCTNRNIVRQLILYGANVNVKDRHGYTPLVSMFSPVIGDPSQAWKLGTLTPDAKCELMLVNAGCNVNVHDNEGYTALMKASYPPLVRRLIDRGADVNATIRGVSPLGFAVYNDDWYKAEVLIRHGADVDAADSYGRTPLATAACNARVGLISLLIAHGADVNHKSRDGRTALMSGSSVGRTDAASCLIDHGANVNAVDENGWTALIWAARDGSLPCVRLLLSRGASVRPKNAKSQILALASASTYHTPQIIALLRAHGAR